MLEREKVLTLTRARTRMVDVPLLGEQMEVRLFTKREIDEMRAESMVAGEVNNDKFSSLLFLRGCLNPSFTDADYDELVKGNAAVYYAMLNAVMEGNGLTALAQSSARRTFSA